MTAPPASAPHVRQRAPARSGVGARRAASWRLAPLDDSRRDPLDPIRRDECTVNRRNRLTEGPAFLYLDTAYNLRDQTGRVVVSALDRLLDVSPVTAPLRAAVGAPRRRYAALRGCAA